MLSDELKEKTQANHQLLEKRLVAQMRSIQSEQDYTALIAFFYSYFGGLEKAIEQHLDQTRFTDYHTRRKAELLANDLNELGTASPLLATGNQLPVINNHQQALGALYVIEGSTLGGQIIGKMIAKQLPALGNHGLSFFNGYGDDTMPMWERFKLVINQPENLPGDEMIMAANETFLKFSQYIH